MNTMTTVNIDIPRPRAGARRDHDELWAVLEHVVDPEIPVVSIRELGVLRGVDYRDGKVAVTITPTYSGCPAMAQIEADVLECLLGAGYPDVEVKTQLAPAWTTDWMAQEAKVKLAEYGIAPPNACGAQGRDNRPQACPQCGSADLQLISEFGSTACKALYRCADCKEPFDYFKCL